MSKRIIFLDSLRGLGAITVIVTHLAEIYKQDSLLKELLQPIGRGSMLLFFILSGIVLSMNLVNIDKITLSNYFSYIIKRFTRIYIPFIVILVLAEILWLILQPAGIPTLSPWFNNVGTDAGNISIFLHNLLMSGNYVDRIDPVIWTLIIEMRVSIIFPFLYKLLRNKSLFQIGTVAALVFFIGTLYLFLFGKTYLIGETIYNSGFFIIGIAFFLHWKKFKFFKKKPLLKNTMLISSMIMYLHVSILHLFGIHQIQVISDIFLGFGCIGLLLYCYHTPNAQRKLSSPTYLWLGEISYSIYLVHCLVAILLIYWLHHSMSIIIIQVISLPLIIIFAALTHRLVEFPAIRLGRLFNKRTSN